MTLDTRAQTCYALHMLIFFATLVFWVLVVGFAVRQAAHKMATS